MERLPIYRYKTGEQEIIDENLPKIKGNSISFGNGVFINTENTEYPEKGFVPPQAMWSMNIAKRNLMELIRMFLSLLPYVFLLAFASKKKLLITFIRHYNEMSFRAIKPWVLEKHNQTAITTELEKFIYLFLIELEVSSTDSEKFSQIFSTIIEYDKAYRYRVEDILTEEKEISKKPIREIFRLVRIYGEREQGGVYTKAKYISYALAYLLTNGKIRRAFRTALSWCDIENMKLDAIDQYWVLLREDGYKYLGKTDQERKTILEEKGYKQPKKL